MEQAGRATWTAEPRRVAASESGDEQVQSLMNLRLSPPISSTGIGQFGRVISDI